MAAGGAAALGTGATFVTSEVAPGTFLHRNTDPRRKTNLVNVFWVAPLDDDVTARALLPNCLMRGTKRFPTLQLLTQETERMYGSSLSSDVRKIGERHAVQFRLEFVNDRYLPGDESILAEAISFLREVMNEPALNNDQFDAEMVAQEKETHRRLIEGLLNDKRSYAVVRCIEEVCKDEPFRRHEQGSVDDLDGIDAAQLTALWQKARREDEMHIYFSGNLTLDEAESALAPLLEGLERAPRSLADLPGPRDAGARRDITEQMDVQQAKLVMGYRTSVPFVDERVPGLVVGNGILGSFPHSKLFVNVREGASLCYYASSFVERTQGLLMISSGVELARAQEARDLIEVQLKDVAAGNFTDDELMATKLALGSRLQMIEDSPATLMDIHLSWQQNGADYDLADYRDRIAAVTREEVMAAFANVNADVYYLLAPTEAAAEGSA